MNQVLLQEISNRNNNISEILDSVSELNEYGKISKQELKANLDFKYLYFRKNSRGKRDSVSVTLSTAKNKNARWPIHIHPDCREIIIVTRGKGKLYMDGKEEVKEVGDCIIIEPDTAHGGVALSEDVQIVCVTLPADEYLEKLYNELENDR